MNEQDFKRAIADLDIFKSNPEVLKAQALKLIAALLYDINNTFKRTNKRLIRIIDNLEKVNEGEEE